jgi:hypothetical protein
MRRGKTGQVCDEAHEGKQDKYAHILQAVDLVYPDLKYERIDRAVISL